MIGRVCWRFEQVGSTQDVAFRLAELDAPHGTVVRADYQSAGRGRQDRRWEAAPGSALMFSVILRPNMPLHQLGPVSILVATVLADSFSELTEDPVQIKWPNDVLIDSRKTSGVLLQTRSGPESVAILGIGVNVDSVSDGLPETATFLNRHANSYFDSETLLESILVGLDRMWNAFQPELSAAHISHIDARLWQRGEVVSILDATREVEGRILGVAESGGLRLDVKGSERVMVAGELVRGPRPIAVPKTN